jgi:hypothetical protein
MIHMLITAVHLAALSQLETGDDDAAVSSTGAVSRWQCSYEVWQANAAGVDPRNYEAAKRKVTRIWQSRINHFEKTHQRPPTVQEIGLLWHKPGRVSNPNPEEADYAKRFENLVRKLGKQPL